MILQTAKNIKITMMMTMTIALITATIIKAIKKLKKVKTIETIEKKRIKIHSLKKTVTNQKIQV